MTTRERLRAFGQSAGVALAVLAMCYLQFFGLYASHKRDRFGLAFLVPPVAWWDSVAYWWQPAEWEKNWDVRVQALGRAILTQPEDLTDDAARSAVQDLHNWLDSLPGERRTQLRATMEAWIPEMLAIVYNQFAGRPVVPTDPTRVALIDREPGLAREMNRLRALDQTGFLRDYFGGKVKAPGKPELSDEELRDGAAMQSRVLVATQIAEWFDR